MTRTSVHAQGMGSYPKIVAIKAFVYFADSILLRALARMALIHRDNRRLSSQGCRRRRRSRAKFGFGFGFNIAALKLRPNLNSISD